VQLFALIFVLYLVFVLYKQARFDRLSERKKADTIKRLLDAFDSRNDHV
jgi:hypothetical protein